MSSKVFVQKVKVPRSGRIRTRIFNFNFRNDNGTLPAHLTTSDLILSCGQPSSCKISFNVSLAMIDLLVETKFYVESSYIYRNIYMFSFEMCIWRCKIQTQEYPRVKIGVDRLTIFHRFWKLVEVYPVFLV